MDTAYTFITIFRKIALVNWTTMDIPNSRKKAHIKGYRPIAEEYHARVLLDLKLY